MEINSSDPLDPNGSPDPIFSGAQGGDGVEHRPQQEGGGGLGGGKQRGGGGQ